MPIYEFACSDCQHHFDVFGSYQSREDAQICPSCEGTRTRALFSAVAVTGSATEGETTVASGGGCGGCGGGCACSN